MPECYVDFRRICTVSPDWVDHAKKLASLQETARKALLMQFFLFLTRVRLDEAVFRGAHRWAREESKSPSSVRRPSPASFFPKQQIQEPTTADVFAAAAAVAEDGGVGAAGVFEGVGEERQAVEGAGVVDGLGHLADRAVVPGEPCRSYGKAAVEL